MRLPETRVHFSIDDVRIQRLYDAAEQKSRGNEVDFCGRQVLIEGGGYHKIWLETQPMAGEMYAKRNLQAALNNCLLFMETQRTDGRMPGSITVENGRLTPQFNKFQGFCFAAPALDLAYWIGLDSEYLLALREALSRFDEYLWKNRDSDGDGCLESWCITDTGEDGALRYGDAPFWWEEETPPAGFSAVPIASMDFMGFSVSARDTLCRISGLLGDGDEAFWQRKADEVRTKIRAYLWQEERGACFDRDKHGSVMPTLLHNNLRVMYFGGLHAGMASRFVKEHLLNPEAFWTPFPLPSVAANDPLFRNNPGNDWSGQPEGLTYQRAIRALERYGYSALLPKLAQKLFDAIGEACVFTQQFDPYTGKPSGEKDGYGPTMLSVLEYVSRLYGVHPERETLVWGVWGGKRAEYTQVVDDRRYAIRTDGKTAEASIDGKRVFTCETGGRVITDRAGNILSKEDWRGDPLAKAIP